MLLGKKKSSLVQTRTIGVIGAGRCAGTTHFAVTAAGYVSGVLRHKTSVLEWNDHGDMRRLMNICTEGKTAYPFSVLGVDYYAEAGAEALVLCKTAGYEEVVVDCGTVEEPYLDQFLRCSRQFVLCSFSEWQIGAFLEFAGRWKKAGMSWETLAVFGSEESRRQIEKKLGISILRIPVSADAFAITGDMIKFYQTILE